MPYSDRDLERDLRELGSRVDYPRTPDLSGSARRKIQAEDEARSNRRGLFWLPALSPRWAVAAMFVIVLAVPVLSPAIRDEISGLFVIGGMSAGGDAADSAGKTRSADEDKIMAESAGQAASQAAPSSEPTPESGGAQSEAIQGAGDSTGGRYAEEITLREARQREGDAPILLPRTPGLGRPDAVYAVRLSNRTGLAFVYGARPGLPPLEDSRVGLIITEAPGDLESVYLPDAASKAGVEGVKVDGKRGYWMSGWVPYWIPDVRRDPTFMLNPKESVLFWEQDGRALRLESNLTREEAIRVAESVR